MPKTVKLWFLFLCILLICVVIVGFYYTTEKTESPEPTPAYVLSVYQGRVAVFAAGSDTPEEILNTRITSLPSDEAERLYNGIPAADAAALQQLIEAYCS